ncbi:MAG: T9SS type A sorting domain-containing protein [bacterium]|nr:T9SS type A sorting domain-containing protein [bacterium]
MRNLYTLFFIAVGFTFHSFGQFEAYVQGDLTNTDYAGSTYFYQALDTNEQSIYVDFVNRSGFDSLFIVTRQRLNPVASSWEDGLCWEGNSGFGICIDPSNMTGDFYQLSAGNGAFVAPNDSVELKAQIWPHINDPGTYTYRYYVGTPSNPKMDSVDIEMLLTPLSVPEATLTVGIHPNPASDHINIQAEGFESATLKVIDLLGNTVLNKTLYGSTKIDVSEFRNGIYFVTVATEGSRISRKVVVRH